MPTPKPLTQCPAPKLDWSRPNTPVASDFGDIYFSTDGGLDEARTVFLRGCELPKAWQKTERFVVGELGFGSGLNFLAAWQMWESHKPQNGHLHFVSIEKFPFAKVQLKQALSAWPELASYSEQLIEKWPGRVRGFHRLHFGDVTLTLIHDDIETSLDAIEMKANAWFLDGFSPSKNPDMWSPAIMKKIAALSTSAARLSTFTVAGDVRRSLMEAGFIVERKEGFGRKRHRLEAYLDGEVLPFSYRTDSIPTIIGTGIGGLSLIEAFKKRDIMPNIIEDPDHIPASGNAAALVKPRLDLQDRPESRFFLSAYLYARNTYSDSVIEKGIVHIAKSDQEAQRHVKLCAQAPLGETHLKLGEDNALSLRSALVINPTKYREAVIDTLTITQETLENLPQTSPIFIAVGYGIKSLLPDWPMRFSRGQLTWVKPEKNLSAPKSYGGYALPFDDKILLGATHNRLDNSENPFTLKPSDDSENINQLQKHLSIEAHQANTPSRASIRVTSHDTLPVIGQTPQGAFVLTGLGSRGFVFAPLLAEAIVSRYYGDPMPIEKAVWEKFSAQRLFT